MKSLWKSIVRWFDSQKVDGDPSEGPKRTDWFRLTPLMVLHLMLVLVLWVGWSPIAVGVAVALYFIRMFAITGFYHRYFSHRTFKTSRAMQFAMGVLGNSAAQRGPLWWAAHHRHHHRHSDTENDIHSPHAHGLYESHIGWLTTREAFPTNFDAIPDFAKYPELRFLNRYDVLVPLLLAVSLFGLGMWLEAAAPGLGTNGMQMFVWGFVVSTVVLLHGTCLVNSLAHLVGTRRYETKDKSRNSMFIALVTMGEGWHNNHHKYPGTVRQGFYWWEIDMTYYLLKLMSMVGLIWDMSPLPEAAKSPKASKRAVPMGSAP